MRKTTEKSESITFILKKAAVCGSLAICVSVLVSCGSKTDDGQEDSISVDKEVSTDEQGSTVIEDESQAFSVKDESVEDEQLEWDLIMEANPDIFAWLYVPGTDIDTAVACSLEAPDYYQSHDIEGNESGDGAAYIEYYNVTDMSDFDTCIYGYTDELGSEGLFKDLYNFADPDFFNENQFFFVYTEKGRLAYEIIAAYERDNDDVFRLYDMTTEAGCQEFIDKEYSQKKMGANYRDGYEILSPYYYLVSLTTSLTWDSDKQFVVLGLLVEEDPEGQVNRTFLSADTTDIDAE